MGYYCPAEGRFSERVHHLQIWVMSRLAPQEGRLTMPESKRIKNVTKRFRIIKTIIIANA